MLVLVLVGYIVMERTRHLTLAFETRREMCVCLAAHAGIHDECKLMSISNSYSTVSVNFAMDV